MADDARERDAPPSGLGVLNGEPGPAGDDAGHRLAGTGDRIRAIYQLERHVRPSQQHCFHGNFLWSLGRADWLRSCVMRSKRILARSESGFVRSAR